MHCDRFCADISEEACRTNQEAAAKAIRLLDAGLTLFALDDVSMDRLLVCGQCERARTLAMKHGGSRWLDPDLVMNTCLELAKEIEESSWDRGDEDLQRERKLAYNRDWFRRNAEWNRERVRQWRRKQKEEKETADACGHG